MRQCWKYDSVLNLPLFMNAMLQSTHFAKPSRRRASAMFPFGYMIVPTKFKLLTDSSMTSTSRCRSRDSTKNLASPEKGTSTVGSGFPSASRRNPGQRIPLIIKVMYWKPGRRKARTVEPSRTCSIIARTGLPPCKSTKWRGFSICHTIERCTGDWEPKRPLPCAFAWSSSSQSRCSSGVLRTPSRRTCRKPSETDKSVTLVRLFGSFPRKTTP